MMGRRTIEMHQLQELVRLHRMETGKREVARLLGLSPMTEREYRNAIDAAGLLGGPPDELPDVLCLEKAVREVKPGKVAPQQVSSIEPWGEKIETMVGRGAKPKAIYDALRLKEDGFKGSLSAVKRKCSPRPVWSRRDRVVQNGDRCGAGTERALQAAA